MTENEVIPINLYIKREDIRNLYIEQTPDFDLFINRKSIFEVEL